LRSWLRQNTALASGLAFTVLSQVAIGFLPLFGGPGYEHAFATGLLGPATVLISLSLARARVCTDAAPHRQAITARNVVWGLAYAALHVALALAIAFAHLVHVRACAPFAQVPYFVLSAMMGLLLAGALSPYLAFVVARVRRKRLLATALGIGLPLVFALGSVVRFVSSPMVFAYDPFVGFFSGTLYDTVIAPGATLVTYRVGTVLSIGALLAAAWAWETRARHAAACAGMLALASVAHCLLATKFGHASTRASIAEALGGERVGTRCSVIYPRNLRAVESELLLRDCEAQLYEVETVLGVQATEHVTAFFFRDAEEKKRLMGAAQVYIAKPWRHEVYLQLSGFPHPVLGHELAHVVAGAVGRGPFRIGGSFGGLWPNPGLIEGVATAASPDDEDMTDAQWARAMKDLGILPPLQRIFSMGFLGENSTKSYTVAGAFVAWCMQAYGKATLHRWYRGEALDTIVGKPWSEIEREFHSFLDQEELPERARAFAESKFRRPGVFARACPHLVDQERGFADQSREACDVEQAKKLYDGVLARDPHDHASKLARAQTDLRCGNFEGGQQAVTAMLADLPRGHKDRAREIVADARLLRGDPGAADEYEALAKETIDEDQGRSYDVKALAAKKPELRAPLSALLIGTPDGHAPDMLLAGFALGGVQTDPITRYLVGKNFAQRGLYAEAEQALRDVPTDGLPPRVVRELLRQQLVVACAMRDQRGVVAAGAGMQSAFAFSFGGRRGAFERLQKRCLSPLQK
jgi:hypothetical protein